MRRQRYLRVLVIGAAASLLVISLSSASASSANLSHPYHSTTAITEGSLVSLEPQLSDYVQPANTSNGSRLLGIAVNSNESLLAVDPGTANVQVATTGTATVLVSNINGAISVGNAVSVSPFDGIGMKATPGSNSIGLAQTPFNNRSSGAISQQVTNKNGQVSSIQVGYVRINIAIGVDNVIGAASGSGLERLAQSLTGHPVSTPRLIVSVIVAVVSVVSLVVLIYASIYGSIISVGRNPLAKYAIFHTLSSILVMMVVIAAVSSLTVFLLLH